MRSKAHKLMRRRRRGRRRRRRETKSCGSKGGETSP